MAAPLALWLLRGLLVGVDAAAATVVALSRAALRSTVLLTYAGVQELLAACLARQLGALFQQNRKAVLLTQLLLTPRRLPGRQYTMALHCY